MKSPSLKATKPIPCIFLCETAYKVGDIFICVEMVYPEWWQFWKKPEMVKRRYEVKQ